jgi:salicylate hydroxylase
VRWSLCNGPFLISANIPRNGLDGTIISENKPSAAQSRYRGQRARRTRLQQALIAKVPSDVIKLNKKLVALRDLGSDGVQLRFEDGEEVEADLVIGADGIRSVCPN